MVWRYSSDNSTYARVCLICWEAAVLAGWKAAINVRPRWQRVQSMNLKVECPESYLERYSGDVTFIAWKIRMTWPAAPKNKNWLGSDLKGISWHSSIPTACHTVEVNLTLKQPCSRCLSTGTGNVRTFKMCLGSKDQYNYIGLSNAEKIGTRSLMLPSRSSQLRCE